MPLYEKHLQALHRKPVPGRYSDGDGLSLLVNKAGGMYWQWQTTTTAGKRTDVSYGPYPLVGLALAREKHRQAKLLQREGQDPTAAKREAAQARRLSAVNTFGAVATEWLGVMESKWSATHLQTTIDRIRRDLTPILDARPIADIQAPELLLLLRKVEGRGAVETAHRVRFILSQVFRYAVATGRASRDPAADLVGAMKTPAEGHHAAITDPKKLGQLIRDIKLYKGSRVVRAALLIHALTFQRPNEIRGMRWDELDLDKGEWLISAERMKSSLRKKATGEPHLVPLADAAVVVLKEIEPWTAHGPLVFPGQRGEGRCISENTCRQALRTLGYSNDDQTPHGFRATARTLLDEKLGVRVEVIEAQLAHTVRDNLGRAYNRTTFEDDRRRMMQQWADYLDALAAGENVVAVNFQRAA